MSKTPEGGLPTPETQSSREVLMEKLSAHLDEDLDFGVFERNKVNEQCLERFNKTWDEVRAEMQKNIETGITLVSVPPELEGKEQTHSTEGGVYRGSVVKGKELIPGLLDQSGNWMTKRFLEVLYLRYPHTTFNQDLAIKRAEGIVAEQNYTTADIHKESLRRDVTPEELDAAKILLQDKVEAVLKSHGLEPIEKEGAE